LIVFRQLGITSSQQKAHPSKTAQIPNNRSGRL